MCTLWRAVEGEARSTARGCEVAPTPPAGMSVVVGARRPLLSGSCALQGCDRGATAATCMCDEFCIRYLDCCVDYAEICAPTSAPSCEAKCSSTSAQAIPGGGYCYCDDACDNDFTDNNSHGGCCADHDWRCTADGTKDPLCMDARTQAQAVNAFVAHHVVNRLV